METNRDLPPEGKGRSEHFFKSGKTEINKTLKTYTPYLPRSDKSKSRCHL